MPSEYTFQAFTANFGPFFAIRAIERQISASNTVAPAKTCVPFHEPVVVNKAPETGVPIRMPNEVSPKHIPIRVPTTPR